MRVAGAQISVSNDIKTNVSTILRAIAFAKSEHADILLTPEGSLSGYRHDFNQSEVQEALELILATSRESGVALALGTCFQEQNGLHYNQLRFYDAKANLIGWHAKILLCKRVSTEDVGELDQFATKPLSTFSLGGFTCGGLICNDLWANPEWTPQPDPHLSKQLAMMGASILFVSVNSSLGKGDQLELIRQFHDSNIRLRARAGQQWMVLADAADPSGRLSSMAPSGVVGPNGDWLLKVDGHGEQLFSLTIDLE